MKRIKFYAHLVNEVDGVDKSTNEEKVRAMALIADLVPVVANIYKGTPIYVGNGKETFQYEDVIEFDDITESDVNQILKNFTFARVLV